MKIRGAMYNGPQQDRYADGVDLLPPPVGPGNIAGTFDDAIIFITGGTGFIGQILINKLLYCCPNIRKIYLLIRPRRGKSAQDRLCEMLSTSIFQTMKIKVRNYREKFVAFPGDCSLSHLGLSELDQEIIVKNTNFVFHCAAIKNPDELIRLSAQVNVRALSDLLRMANRMKELKAFLYVSTVYSNYPHTEIEEKFYEPPIEADKLLSLVHSLDDDQLKIITPNLLGKYPNVYLYTKAVAESLVRDSDENLPIAMVRIGLATATLMEPVAGWINNTDGPTGILCGTEMGILHTFYLDADCHVELVPADFVCNLVLTATWSIAKTRKMTENHEVLSEVMPIPIYNFISSTINPLTSSSFIQTAQMASAEIPSVKMLWKRFCMVASNQQLLVLYLFAFHYVPAFLIDAALFITGKTPIFLSTFSKIYNKSINALEYLHKRTWLIHDDNTKQLLKELCPVDKLNFNFDLSELRWDVYFYIYMRGIRVYLLEDPLETIPKAQRKNLFLKIAHYTLCLVLATSTWKLFMSFAYERLLGLL